MRLSITPPRLYQMFIVFMAAIFFLLPQTRVIPFQYNLIGIIVFVGGAYLAIYVKRIFKKTVTPISPSAKPVRLHTEGIYKYSRNPMYLGIGIGLLGIALFTGCIINLIFPLLFLMIMNYKYVKIEERKLEIVFGETYDNYRRIVRRWI